MNYRSFADLEQCIRNNLYKIPRDTDLIVGVPRSGILVSTILALYLNLPLTDVKGFLEGRVLASGERLKTVDQTTIIKNARRILVFDDSINSGREMRRTRRQLAPILSTKEVTFGVVYATKHTLNEVDLYFEICPTPRIFSWNLMHHSLLKYACVDIDGVLCRDPSEEQNDDGPRYLEFLQQATPLLVPTVTVGTLVTCRLEKYRSQTERWLTKYGIKYDELVMWDLPSKKIRQEMGGHAYFKASVFKSRPQSIVFIESSRSQAREIADYSCKPVICIEDQRLYLPSMSALIRNTIRKAPFSLGRKTSRLISYLHRNLMRINRY